MKRRLATEDEESHALFPLIFCLFGDKTDKYHKNLEEMWLSTQAKPVGELVRGIVYVDETLTDEWRRRLTKLPDLVLVEVGAWGFPKLKRTMWRYLHLHTFPVCMTLDADLANFYISKRLIRRFQRLGATGTRSAVYTMDINWTVGKDAFRPRIAGGQTIFVRAPDLTDSLATWPHTTYGCDERWLSVVAPRHFDFVREENPEAPIRQSLVAPAWGPRVRDLLEASPHRFYVQVPDVDALSDEDKWEAQLFGASVGSQSRKKHMRLKLSIV